MLIVPECHNEWLELTPLTQKHSAGMFALWSDVRVTQYSGPVKDYDGNAIKMPATTVQDSDRIIDFWLRAASDGWGFRWAIMLPAKSGDPKFAGILGFNALGERAEIAWHLLPTFWGQGAMLRACRLALSWLSAQGCRQLEAYIEPENRASIALATRLGLMATGEISDNAERYLTTLAHDSQR